jgi:hypothetical protein
MIEVPRDILIKELFYDLDSGLFTWISERSQMTRFRGKLAGHAKKNGYVEIRILDKLIYAHRLAWLYVHGEMPCGVIDHIDGNASNNRIQNLRDVDCRTNSENKRNSLPNTSSEFLGVCWDKQTEKWIAQIGVHGKHVKLGRFSDENDAKNAYIEAKRKLHAGCTI